MLQERKSRYKTVIALPFIQEEDIRDESPSKGFNNSNSNSKKKE